MKTLIIGGTSGLGLALAKLYALEGEVIVTGRKNPLQPNFTFFPLELHSASLQSDIVTLLNQVGDIDRFVYAAGYFQEGTLDQLSLENIDEMLNVGIRAPLFMLRHILKRQKTLQELLLVTSTSQWTPRVDEPVYTAVKAGLGMLGNSLALDPNITKVTVAGPGGMNTEFWHQTDRDMSVMLDPEWVAKTIVSETEQDYSYKFFKVLREPARIELVEIRE